MLPVAAREIRYPMTLFILMVAHNLLLHPLPPSVAFHKQPVRAGYDA